MVARRTRLVGLIAALIALCLYAVAPAALAGIATDPKGENSAPGQEKKNDASQEQSSSSTDSGDKDGDADSDPNTAYNEDNDTNDGGTPNNQPDEGDNQHPSGKDRSVENGGSGNQGKSESHPDDSKGPMRCEGTCGEADKPNGGGGTDKADQDGNNGCGNDDDFDDDNNGWCGKPKDKDTEQPPTTCPAGTEMHGNKCETPPPTTCPAGTEMHGNKCETPPTQTCPAGTTMGTNGQCTTPPVDNTCPAGTTMGTNGQCTTPPTQTCPAGTIMGTNGQCSTPPLVEGEIIDRCDSFLMGPIDVCRPAPGVGPTEDTTQPAPDSVLGERITRPVVAPAAVAPAAEEQGGVLPFTGGNVVPLVVIGLLLIIIGGFALRSRSNS
ncbi:MAG: hypothetical protein QOG54_2131 [Actinomycetota bacterium]|nr:hypothetical protein [Actinomycetota bacterium]